MVEMRSLAAAVLIFISACAELAAVSVRFEATPADSGSSTGSTVALRLVPQGDSHAPLNLTLQVPGSVVGDLPEGTTWQVVADSSELWSAPRWIAPSAESSEVLVTLRFFPAAKVTGSLQAPAGAPLPDVVDLQIEGAPDAASPKPARTTLRCPVKERRFLCSVPARRLDLRLRTEGFVPAYVWDVDFMSGETRDLGALALKIGASVVGWVRAEGTQGVAGVSVRLQPQTFGQPVEPGQIAGLQAAAVETKTNDRGFFQFESVEPGTKLVTASREGLVPASRAGIEVRPGLEAQILEPLLLAKPLSVRVVIDPQESPSGRPWNATLSARSGLAEPQGSVYQGETDSQGVWTLTGVGAGTYSLLLQDGEARWLFEDLEVSPNTREIPITVPGVRIRGRLLLGEKPFQATVWFGGRSASERAGFAADEDGEFEGLLPREGTWPVEVMLEREGAGRVKLEPLEIRKLPGSRYAHVEIRAPNTRLWGQVVDEGGNPVPRAHLILQPLPGTATSFDCDRDGSFDVLGLAAGPLMVRAEEGERESEWVQAVIQENHEPDALRLVLRNRVSIHGVITSRRGPVPGAWIEALSELNDAGAGSADQVVSGAAGEFTLRMPAGTRKVYVNVLAPGYATRMMIVPLDAARPFLEIALEEIGGTLIFDFGDRTREEVLQLRAGLLAHEGSFVSLGSAWNWTRIRREPQLDPHRLVLPNMEPGEYLLCLGPEAQQAIPRGQEAPPSQCMRGYLAPLQELTLRLPT